MQLRVLIEEEDSLDEIISIVKTELSKAAAAKKHPFKYVAFSTISGSKVSSRWVVFRKYTEQGNLLIYTDYRSGKVSDLEKNSSATLLFYHDKKKLQVRVTGEVTVHNQDELTKKYWPGVKGLSDKSYTTKIAPGKEIPVKDEGYEWDSDFDDRFFTILEVIPTEIEVLQLNGDRHIRAKFEKQKFDWVSRFLVP